MLQNHQQAVYWSSAFGLRRPWKLKFLFSINNPWWRLFNGDAYQATKLERAVCAKHQWRERDFTAIIGNVLKIHLRLSWFPFKCCAHKKCAKSRKRARSLICNCEIDDLLWILLSYIRNFFLESRHLFFPSFILSPLFFFWVKSGIKANTFTGLETFAEQSHPFSSEQVDSEAEKSATLFFASVASFDFF